LRSSNWRRRRFFAITSIYSLKISSSLVRLRWQIMCHSYQLFGTKLIQHCRRGNKSPVICQRQISISCHYRGRGTSALCMSVLRLKVLSNQFLLGWKLFTRRGLTCDILRYIFWTFLTYIWMFNCNLMFNPLYAQPRPIHTYHFQTFF